jgi:hypothetical protein
LQHIFYTDLTPKEYSQLDDLDGIVSRPESCLNPACKIPVPPKKHDFYQRNCIDLGYAVRIKIRRYFCPYCGMTFSYLPAFCLPFFQYSSCIIFLTLRCHFSRMLSFLNVIIQAYQLSLQRQHRQFYSRRFLANLKRIQLVLRELVPGLVLPDDQDIRKGAKKLLRIIRAGFTTIQTFSQRYFAQCNHSFMTPCKLF